MAGTFTQCLHLTAVRGRVEVAVPFLMLSEQDGRGYLHWGKTLLSNGMEHITDLPRSRLTKSGSDPPTGKLSNPRVGLLARDALGEMLDMDVIGVSSKTSEHDDVPETDRTCGTCCTDWQMEHTSARWAWTRMPLGCPWKLKQHNIRGVFESAAPSNFGAATVQHRYRSTVTYVTQKG